MWQFKLDRRAKSLRFRRTCKGIFALNAAENPFKQSTTTE